MVAGKSPEWLPPGFTEKVKYKNGRKIKYFLNVATGTKYHSKKDVLRCTTEDNGKLVTPQKENVDYNGLSSDGKVDAISVKTIDSPAWLPNGWIMEERTRQSGSSKGLVYKVYTDLSSGSKFYSKAAVTRYLNTVDHVNSMTIQNKIDNVDKPKVDEPKADETKVDEPNVDAPSIDMSPQFTPKTNTGGIHKKKRKDNTFVVVSVEITTDDNLPSGWIKEIKTSKCGDRIRKDPFYMDPVSGYVFRSKLDALRYLKTNDIGSCACRPLKRNLDDAKLIENGIPSSNPANEKLSVHKRQRLLGGEPNRGQENSGTTSLAEPGATISNQQQGNDESSIMNNPEPEKDISKEDGKVMAVDVAISSPITDPITKQQFSDSENKTKVGSRKSKKRRESSLPLRTSKRLAGSQPEIPSNSILNERSLRAAARSSGSEVDKSPSFPSKASANIPMPSDIEPAKVAAEHAFIGEETHQDIDPPKEVENLPNEDEKPPTEGPAILEEQSSGKASENQFDDGKMSQESQLCYDFGDSWSDPLEFAFKTLRGEISIDDTLAFPSCFNEPISTPYNQADGCLKQSQSDVPINFQNEFASHSESSKQNSAVDQLPANSPSFPALGNISFPSFGGFNCQSSTEVGKTDSQTKFNP